MPSLVWELDLQTAYQNPYEYASQEQFIKESKLLVRSFLDELSNFDMKFKVTDRTSEKAIWMLLTDAVHAIYEIVSLMKEKRTNVASRLFRDVDETSDLASYFNANPKGCEANLKKWFENEIIPHRVYRNYIGKEYGKSREDKAREEYRNISKLSHRTYVTLKYGYMLGRDDYIAYDGFDEEPYFRLPQTVSMYMVLLGDYIKRISTQLHNCNLIDKAKIVEIWQTSLDETTVPRRFIPAKEIYEEYKRTKKDDL